MARFILTAILCLIAFTMTACNQAVDIAKHTMGLDSSPSVEEAIIGYWLSDDGESYVFEEGGKVSHDGVEGTVNIVNDTLHIVYTDASTEEYNIILDYNADTLTLGDKVFYGDASKQQEVRDTLSDNNAIVDKIAELKTFYDEYLKESMPDSKAYTSKISECEYQISVCNDTIDDDKEAITIAEGYIKQYEDSMKGKPDYTITVDDEGNEVHEPIEEPEFIKEQREALSSLNSEVASMEAKIKEQENEISRLRTERLKVLTEFYEGNRFYEEGPIDTESREHISATLSGTTIYFPYEDGEYILVLDATKQYQDDDGFIQYGKSTKSWLYVKSEGVLYDSTGVAVS